MSSNFKITKNFVTFIILTILFSSLFLLVPIYNLKRDAVTYIDEEPSFDNSNKIDTVLSEISDNWEVVSKFSIDGKYTNILLHSVVSEEANLFESHVYDNEKGLEVNFNELLKKDTSEDFWNKVYELLSLKYPEFIVNGIKNSVGVNAYDIKDNEMVIYFMNYTIEPVVDELITLKVNYNEIKDYINFSCKLDAIYENEDGFDYSSGKKTVALTYDDGPKGDKTAKILEILAKNKARATFFMVGNIMSRDQKTVKKVYESGNEIGSHTYAHANLNRQTVTERMEALKKTDEIYNQITGDNIDLLRPPYGAYKKDMLTEFNYSVVLWSIDTEDWRYRNVECIIDTVLTNLSDGSIILMHDSYSTTIEATEKLLPILYAKGYQVVSVSELARLKGVELEKNMAYRKIK